MNQRFVPAVELYGDPDSASLLYRFRKVMLVGTDLCRADVPLCALSRHVQDEIGPGVSLRLYRSQARVEVEALSGAEVRIVRSNVHIHVTGRVGLRNGDRIFVCTDSHEYDLRLCTVKVRDGVVALLQEVDSPVMHVLMNEAHSVDAVMTEECRFRGTLRDLYKNPWQLPSLVAKGAALEEFQAVFAGLLD